MLIHDFLVRRVGRVDVEDEVSPARILDLVIQLQLQLEFLARSRLSARES